MDKKHHSGRNTKQVISQRPECGRSRCYTAIAVTTLLPDDMARGVDPSIPGTSHRFAYVNPKRYRMITLLLH